MLHKDVEPYKGGEGWWLYVPDPTSAKNENVAFLERGVNILHVTIHLNP